MAEGVDAGWTSLTKWQRMAILLQLFWFFLPLFVVIFGEIFFSGTALTSHPHFGFYCSVTIFWVEVNALIWPMIPDVRRQKLISLPAQQLFSMVSLVVCYLFVILPYFSRRIIEILAFTGLNAPATEAHLSIAYETGRKSWNYAVVGPIFGQQGREVSVKVNKEVRQLYRHVSTHDKDCFRVSVQNGRFGFQRIIGPDRFDDGLTKDHIVKNCAIGISH
jgi:hypothetical protein